VSPIAPGFTGAAHAGQRHFRAVLDALARPGGPVPLTGELPEAPAPLAAGVYALALALLDLETPVWPAPPLDAAAVTTALRFHCGCPIVDGPGEGPAARLRGPGIAGDVTLAVARAPAGWWLALAANHARFPQGVDLLLVAHRQVVGLPRSTAVEPL
jgi:alpha-D-ribose 1-methylphosphonate 5-triphosphate synthase subunit PhnH